MQSSGGEEETSDRPPAAAVVDVSPSAPAPAPRPVTPLVRRRAWTEPSVRLWWLMAAAVQVAVGIYAGDRLATRRGENRLLVQGVPVRATVRSNQYHSTPGQTADADQPTTVRFPWHGQPLDENGMLTRATTIGATVDLHVDPLDPSLWTDRTAPTPALRAVSIGLVLLPVAAVLAGVAAARARGVARTYRLATAAVAVVTDRRQVPIAPLCHAIRCAMRDGPDRRIRTVYVPPAGRSLARGDEVWLLVPAEGRGRPVAAMWFE